MAIDEDAVPEAVDFEVGTAPVLVRPYGGGHAVPVGRHARKGSGRGPWLVLLAASGATATVLTVAAVVIAGTGGPPAQDLSGRIRPSAPGVSRPGPAMPGGSGQPASAVPGTADSPLSGQTRAPVGSVGTDPAPAPPGGPAQSTGPAPTSPAAPADPTTPVAQPDPSPSPPAVAVTGRITNTTGMCLSAVGLNDRVRLWDCDGSTGQAWTLATDGTVRALGQCLQPSSSLTRLSDCDGSVAQQWRTGAWLSLVNPGSATCLGDPGAGTTRGTPQRTAPCDQSDAQRWTLPQAG